MVSDMSYITVSSVLDSWEQIRRIPDYDKKIGQLLFEKFFQLEPTAKIIFGFEADEKVASCPRFESHAKHFVQMIDKAMEMLGPDIELLTEILFELGGKHVNYGVKPEYFPSMGRALLHSIAVSLGEDCTEQIRSAWVEVYGAMSYDMVRAQKAHRHAVRQDSR